MGSTTDRSPSEVAQQRSAEAINAALHVLITLPADGAIGAACAVLLDAVYNQPVMLRRVLMEPVNREGHRGVSLLELFKRACR